MPASSRTLTPRARCWRWKRLSIATAGVSPGSLFRRKAHSESELASAARCSPHQPGVASCQPSQGRDSGFRSSAAPRPFPCIAPRGPVQVERASATPAGGPRPGWRANARTPLLLLPSLPAAAPLPPGRGAAQAGEWPRLVGPGRSSNCSTRGRNRSGRARYTGRRPAVRFMGGPSLVRSKGAMTRPATVSGCRLLFEGQTESPAVRRSTPVGRS
jgi:hypothetical protein